MPNGKPPTMQEMQASYWNKTSDEYQSITRIKCDDFHYGPQLPGELSLQLLPPLKPGQKALELGCGAAQNSIWLTKQGIQCTAVDIAQAQLDHAQRLIQQHNVSIKLCCSPLETYLETLNTQFDLIHSAHAFEFIQHPAKLLAQISEKLLPGGTLIFSTVHPLYNNDWAEDVDENDNVIDRGLWVRNYFSPPDDIRTIEGEVEVISRAYPTAEWFKWLRMANLNVTNLLEPPAVNYASDAPYTSSDWSNHNGELHLIPVSIIFVAQKPVPFVCE